MTRDYLSDEIERFLDAFPNMTTASFRGRGRLLRGQFYFAAREKGEEIIEATYHLEFLIPRNFPQALPEVRELDGRIPRHDDYHVHPNGSLCLGAPLRLLMILRERPGLVSYAHNCVIPYLYAIICKIQGKKDYAFGELKHGKDGRYCDYAGLFGLKNKDEVDYCFELLGMKRRRANKLLCPCGCGKILRKCNFHRKVVQARKAHLAYGSG